MSVGKISEFQLGKGNWKTYIARLNQYIKANKIEDDLKTSTLLTVIGDETYELIADLCSPVEPATKSYQELIALVTNHLQPEPSVMMERRKFRHRYQEKGESITQYVAVLKNLARTCNFEDKLDENLREQLSSGIISESIKQRLLVDDKDKKLTFTIAYEIARNMEAAENDVNLLESTQQVHKIQGQMRRLSVSTANPSGSSSRYPRLRAQDGRWDEPSTSSEWKKPVRECSCCGRVNHQSSECFFKNAVCVRCGKIGHLKYVCSRKSNRQRQRNKKGNFYMTDESQTFGNVKSLEESDSDRSLELYNIFSSNNKNCSPITIKVLVENIKLDMEVDTGSALSLISRCIYDKYFSRKEIFQSKIKLASYTGNRILTEGYIKVNVVFNNYSEILKLYIIPDGGPSLLGRNWLKALKINIIDNVAVHNIAARDKEDIKTGVDKKSLTLKGLIDQYKIIFDTELGHFLNFKAKLYLKPDAIPIFCKARSLPFSMKNKVEKELQRLCENGVLTPVDHSHWASPIVPVLKKNGEVRICGDFKVSVNPNLYINKYPIPKIETIFSCLSGGTLFSKIDLSQAYAQIELDEDSKTIVTINTHKGLFRYNRLPYGIASSPAIFMKIMDELFAGLDGVIVFLDDILVTGRDHSQHMERLCRVFNIIKNSGLKINLEKCSFFQKSISYLGYTIDAGGLHPSGDKVEAIIKMHCPTNKTELKSFLGMITYYGKFLPNLSTQVNKLYNLLKNNVKWHWDKDCQKAFNWVKSELASPKVLAHYDSSLPLALWCDASSVGVGAVISHIYPNGDIKPIAHASRTLNNSEKNFSQIDREALSIIYGVKRFHEFLFARKFILFSDHKPLLTIFGEKKNIPQLAASRLQRWAIILAAYQYEIKYINSEKNQADALSRLPLPHINNKDPDFGHILYVQEAVPIDYKKIAVETQKDKILNVVYRYCFMGWSENKDIPVEIKPYFYRRNELHLEHGCILWGYRVVIPSSLQQIILQEIHSSHLGINKCKSIARSYCYWPKIDMDIENLCKNCNICTKIQDNPQKAILQPWPQTNKPWSRLHVDFLGPIFNEKYIIITDSHTKWLEIFKMRNTSAKVVINCLRSLFARFGLPDTLVSDNGPPFSSIELSDYLKCNGIKHLFSPPYHAQSNGAAENCVKNIKKALKKAYMEKVDLDEAIQRFLFNYRISHHCTTGVSPAMLMFGRPLKTRLDLIRPSQSNINNDKIQKQIDNFKGKQIDMGNDSSVFIKEFSDSSKPTWVPGKVVNKTGSVTYEVQTGDNKIVKRHSNQLKKRMSLCFPFPGAESSNGTEDKKISDDVGTPDSKAPKELSSDDNNIMEFPDSNGEPNLVQSSPNKLDVTAHTSSGGKYGLRNRKNIIKPDFYQPSTSK